MVIGLLIEFVVPRPQMIRQLASVLWNRAEDMLNEDRVVLNDNIEVDLV